MASLLVQYFEFLKPVDKSEVLVSRPKERIQPSLGLAMARNPEIDCSNGRLAALRAPNGPQRAKIPEADWTSPLPEHGEVNQNGAPSSGYTTTPGYRIESSLS